MIAMMLEWITQTILILGYMGIFFLMTLESIILPLPSEAILPFAGYLVSTGEMNLWLVTLAATLGSLLGSAVSYAIGRYGGRQFIDVYGRYVLFDKAKLERTEKWFQRHGSTAVFLARLLPMVRYFISFVAGIAQMQPRSFFISTAAGSLLWNLLFILIGMWFGQQWQRYAGETATVEAVLVTIIIFIAIFLAARAIRRHRETMFHGARNVQAKMGKQLQLMTRKRR